MYSLLEVCIGTNYQMLITEDNVNERSVSVQIYKCFKNGGIISITVDSILKPIL